MLKVGHKAPAFKLPSTSGGTVSLKDFAGRRLVLYFYPRDNTSGCTTEACDFRDNMARLTAAGVEVVGVSKDSLASHEKFQAKHDLPFQLLTDADNKVATRYGAYGEKKMYGKTVMGTIRSTFLINEEGRIQALWTKVRVKGHVDRVLEALEQ
jgi:peroxiredoxin Q/BCP